MAYSRAFRVSNAHGIEHTFEPGPYVVGGHARTTAARSAGRQSGAEKDPESWVTGDEPMTASHRNYLDTLAREAGEQLSPDLTKAEASEHIERLQHKTGRTSG